MLSNVSCIFFYSSGNFYFQKCHFYNCFQELGNDKNNISLDPDQVQPFVRPYLVRNHCLQRLSAVNAGRLGAIGSASANSLESYLGRTLMIYLHIVTLTLHNATLMS